MIVSIGTRALVIPLLFLVTIGFPACEGDGPTASSNRTLKQTSSNLHITPSALDFGESADEILLEIENHMNRGFNWTARPSVGWLALPESGRIEGGRSQVVRVIASRGKLSEPGQYRATIQFESPAGNRSISVTLVVPLGAPAGETTGLRAIDATGTSDVTDPLNSYLASLPDGSILTLPAGAKYRVEGTVLLNGLRNVTIEGNNALIFATTDGGRVPSTLRDWPRNRYHVEIRGGSGIVIRNLKVRGANPRAGMGDEAYVERLEAQHGFAIRGATDIELDHVEVSDVYGDFVYVGQGADDDWSRDVHIHDSHFERNGRQGIAITKGRGVLFERNYIGNTRRATFDLEPPGIAGGALDVVIRNNVVGEGRLKFLAASGRGPNISFTVENNVVHRPMTIVVETSPEYRRGPISVIGNRSNWAAGSPTEGVLIFERVDGLVVRENYQPVQEWRNQTFVFACESRAVDVRNNDVPGAGRELELVNACPSSGH